MASRGPHPEDPGDERGPGFARRALGARHRLRLLAIALWSSFLGAILILLFVIALLPADVCAQLGLGELSVMFLASWVLTLVPVGVAMFLATPPSGLPGLDRHGR